MTQPHLPSPHISPLPVPHSASLPLSSRAEHACPPILCNLSDKYPSVPYNLSVGMTFHTPSPSILKFAAANLSDPTLSRYGFILGDETLRTIWANVLSNAYPLPSPLLSPREALPHHELMITAGSNQAFLNVVLALCDPSDEVLLPVPYYYPHQIALQLSSITPVHVPTNATTFLPSVPDIASRITPRTRALVLVNPGNPSGVVYPRALLESIAALCRKSSIWLVLDLAYREFVYCGPSPLVHVPESRDGVICMYTVSKAYALPGWRVGAVVYPKRLSLSMLKVQETVPTHAAKFSQLIAGEALRHDPLEAPADGLAPIAELDAVRRVLIEVLQRVYEHSSLAKRFVVPNGAFYFFLPYQPQGGGEATEESDMWAIDYLTQHDILLAPGFAFGMAGYLRLSYGSVRLDMTKELTSVLVGALKAIV